MSSPDVKHCPKCGRECGRLDPSCFCGHEFWPDLKPRGEVQSAPTGLRNYSASGPLLGVAGLLIAAWILAPTLTGASKDAAETPVTSQPGSSQDSPPVTERFGGCHSPRAEYRNEVAVQPGF